MPSLRRQLQVPNITRVFIILFQCTLQCMPRQNIQHHENLQKSFGKNGRGPAYSSDLDLPSALLPQKGPAPWVMQKQDMEIWNRNLEKSCSNHHVCIYLMASGKNLPTQVVDDGDLQQVLSLTDAGMYWYMMTCFRSHSKKHVMTKPVYFAVPKWFYDKQPMIAFVQWLPTLGLSVTFLILWSCFSHRTSGMTAHIGLLCDQKNMSVTSSFASTLNFFVQVFNNRPPCVEMESSMILRETGRPRAAVNGQTLQLPGIKSHRKEICLLCCRHNFSMGAKTQHQHGSKGRGATASEKICSPLEPWAASRIQEIQCDGDCTMFKTLNMFEPLTPTKSRVVQTGMQECDLCPKTFNWLELQALR